MVVLVVRSAPDRVRGYARRYLIEIDIGVYVGDLSARVRARMWSWIIANITDGSAVLAHSAQSEQGYRVETIGLAKRDIVDCDGIQMSRILGSG